jgi:hypothetical protein
MKDEFFELSRDNIYKELIRANKNFAIFNQLYQAIETYIKLPQKYKAYFGESMKAHYDVFVISVYNVTKEDKDTGSIKRLFNYINSTKLSGHFNSDKINQMSKSLNSVMDTITKLQKMRDQYIGHNQLHKHHSGLVHSTDDCVKALEILNNILIQLSLDYDGKILDIPANPDFAISNIYQDLIIKYESNVK